VTSTRNYVDHIARIDALSFVGQFGRLITRSDADEAWLHLRWNQTIADAGLTPTQAHRLKPVYRWRLHREMSRLMEINSAVRSDTRS
jgi:hypothetical protein